VTVDLLGRLGFPPLSALILVVAEEFFFLDCSSPRCQPLHPVADRRERRRESDRRGPAFCYFRFIDSAAAALPRVRLVDIAYSVVIG
jgi:hypothetical protein